MSSEFEPGNELEQALVAARSGERTVVSFMDKLLESQIFVLVNKDLGPSGRWDESVIPMALSNQDGESVLAVFTAPERATPWAKREPLFGFGVLVNFTWLLKNIPAGVGLVVNPGHRVGLEMPAAGVKDLLARTRRH